MVIWKLKVDVRIKVKNGVSERCFVFAKGRVIIWDSVNIKIPRKVTVGQVREIFKEQGWD